MEGIVSKSQPCTKLLKILPMNGFKSNLDKLFGESRDLEKEIKKQLAGLTYEG